MRRGAGGVLLWRAAELLVAALPWLLPLRGLDAMDIDAELRLTVKEENHWERSFSISSCWEGDRESAHTESSCFSRAPS